MHSITCVCQPANSLDWAPKHPSMLFFLPQFIIQTSTRRHFCLLRMALTRCSRWLRAAAMRWKSLRCFLWVCCWVTHRSKRNVCIHLLLQTYVNPYFEKSPRTRTHTSMRWKSLRCYLWVCCWVIYKNKRNVFVNAHTPRARIQTWMRCSGAVGGRLRNKRSIRGYYAHT